MSFCAVIKNAKLVQYLAFCLFLAFYPTLIPDMFVSKVAGIWLVCDVLNVSLQCDIC